MNEINTDALAEAHYAKYDPAYYNEEDLNEKRERFEEKTINYIETQIKNMFDYLSDDEVEVCKKNADYLSSFLYEHLEEM